MDYKTRILPSREALARVQSQTNLVDDISGIDLVLSLITTADLIRSHIYAKLVQNHQISEGKFALLMSLYGDGEMTSSELAMRIGVTNATVSVMVKRMLTAESPLISMIQNNEDGRSRLISLTTEGLKLIQKALPEHHQAIQSFAQVLDVKEQKSLITMLHKLLRK